MPNERTPEDRSTAARFRERVAAAIALLIILGAVVLMVCAFHAIDDEKKFDRAKDLLLIVNPILGVVVGYYFNKVSTEARAESAESTARAAAETARQASASRDKAEELAAAASSEAHEVRAQLDAVSQAAEKVLAQVPARAVGTLQVGERERATDDARWELEAALARAKRTRSPATSPRGQTAGEED